MKSNTFITIIFSLACAINAIGQAKKPTIMVMPSEVWCFENGFTEKFESQGEISQIPDYKKAYQENSDINNVTTKLGELMSERNFPLKDLVSTMRDIQRSKAEDAITTSSTSHAELAETPLEKLLQRAKADIIIEVAWKINKSGPKNSITYNLRGLDAYTNKQIAAVQGTGSPSFSAEIPTLLEEAVIANMDNFIAQLQNHFDDLIENGREVVLNIKIFDNGSGLNFESEYTDMELVDIIDEWMAQNTVKHRYNLTDAGENRLSFEQVRIPLYRKNGMPMDTRNFANNLRKYLGAEPYNITSKIITKGLGRVDLILGEK